MLRELIARAISFEDEDCASTATYDDFCQGDPAVNCECRNKADAIIAALDKAGLVVVPREPTEEMETAGRLAYMPPTTHVRYTTSMAEAWVHMVSASPYAKGAKE